MVGSNFINFLILSSVFLMLFAFAEWLHHFRKINAEYTRKVVHVGTGLLTMLFPLAFTRTYWVLIICGSFLILLLLSKKFNLLKSINAVPRVTYGSFLYPIVVVLAFWFFVNNDETPHRWMRFGNTALFYLPILIMAIADPMAAYFGSRNPVFPFYIFGQKKTISGFFAFSVTAALVSFLFIEFAQWPLVVLLAFSTAIAEALSSHGFDNFTIPLVAILVLQIFL